MGIFFGKGRSPFAEGFRFAPRLGWLCQPATLRAAQSVFCGVHAAAKNGFHFIRAVRGANSVRQF